MLENPRPRFSRCHVRQITAGVVGGHNVAEGDQLSVRVRRAHRVVRRTGDIAPYILTALEMSIMSKHQSTRRDWWGTLIHILALPAQLRKSFCRSLREKNRSSTEMLFVS